MRSRVSSQHPCCGTVCITAQDTLGLGEQRGDGGRLTLVEGKLITIAQTNIIDHKCMQLPVKIDDTM